MRLNVSYNAIIETKEYLPAEQQNYSKTHLVTLILYLWRFFAWPISSPAHFNKKKDEHILSRKYGIRSQLSLFSLDSRSTLFPVTRSPLGTEIWTSNRNLRRLPVHFHYDFNNLFSKPGCSALRKWPSPLCSDNLFCSIIFSCKII